MELPCLPVDVLDSFEMPRDLMLAFRLLSDCRSSESLDLPSRFCIFSFVSLEKVRGALLVLAFLLIDSLLALRIVLLLSQPVYPDETLRLAFSEVMEGLFLRALERPRRLPLGLRSLELAGGGRIVKPQMTSSEFGTLGSLDSVRILARLSRLM